MVIHGFKLLGGIRGETVAGQGATPNLVAAYTIDFASASLGLRAEFSQKQIDTENEIQSLEQSEASLGITAQRFIDLDTLSFSLGVLVEGVALRQSFDARGDAPERIGYGLGFGAVLGIERSLWGRISLRLEGGPRSYLFSQAVVDGGEAIGRELKTPLTWTANAGLVVRL